MKQISSSSQRKIGVVLSYIHIALQILVGIIYTPYLLRTIGQNEYGLINTVMQAAEMLNLFNLGFSASYIRFYSLFKANGEKQRINSFNSLFFIAFSILSALVLIAGLVISFNLKLIFDEGLTSEELGKARVMMIMLTVSMAFGFMVTLFTCYVSARERFIFAKGNHVLNVIMMLVLNLIVLFMGGSSVELIAVRAGVAIFLNALYVIYCFTKLHIRFDFKHIEKSLFKKVFLFSSLIAINIIVDKVNQGIDSLLLGRFCGTAAVAVYAIGSTLCSYFITFAHSVSGVFTPLVHNIVHSYPMDSKEQRKAITDLFVKVARVQYLLMALILSGFIIFGQKFIWLWAGEGYEKSYYIALVMMVPSIVPLTQNIGVEIQRAENRHHYRSYIYGLMAILNLIISIILVQKYEGLGAAIGTGISYLIANCIIMNVVFHKKINVDVTAYFKNLSKQTLGMIIPFIAGAFIMQYSNIHNWTTLVLWAAIYSVIYFVFIWFFSMNSYEKSLVTNIIDKILKSHLTSKIK